MTQRPCQCRYRFALDRVQGDWLKDDLVMTCSVYFWWSDAHRSWSQSEIPLDAIFVPATELWTPALRVVYALDAFNELAVDPVSTARVWQNGTVR